MQSSRLLSKVEKLLKKETLECYVLMVCNKSETTDEMIVDMAYDGDEVLGCYMLENALSILGKKAKDVDAQSDDHDPFS